MIENYLNKFRQIPHYVFSMDLNDRKNYLNKIQEYVNNIKEELKKTKFNLNNNYLNNDFPNVFMLSYYGLNVKDIIVDITSIYKDLFIEEINKINFKYSCKNNYNKPYKKILFCSSRLGQFSSVFRSTENIIRHLSSLDKFHVDVITKNINKNDDKIKNCFKNCKNVFEKNSTLECIDIIGGGRYDAIIYPDMNMDALTSCLGLFRLAPIQINTFGHSETSGLVDYFISSKFYEHENSQENYKEKLIQFDSLALDYAKLPDVNQKLNREYFQIPKNSNVYFCNSSLFKFGKEMFLIFEKILENDDQAIIVLTKLNFPYWDSSFFSFLEHQVSNKYINRIKFLPRLNPLENSNMLELSDVYIESYPFGNMNSTLECFKHGLPVVSMPTLKLNGRFTYGFYKKIKLEKEYCFDNIDDYVKKSIEIATNKNLDLRNEIKDKSKILFEEKESSEEWEKFLYY